MEKSMTAAAPEAALADLREQIDDLDRQLLDLLIARARLAAGIGDLKPAGGSYRADRESMVLKRLLAANPGPLSDEQVHRVFREIVSACRAMQQVPSVACLGPEGTFSHQAALERFGHDVQLELAADVSEVFREVESGNCNYGMVPVENSFEGSVHATLDLLADTSLCICGESELSVRHCLLGHQSDEISAVAAHPQALAQCRRWLDNHLPRARRVAAESTAAAARDVAREGSRGKAAIGTRAAAELHGLAVLASGIEDDPRNSTRFIVIGRDTTAATGNDKTSVLFTVANRPGALYRALSCFAERGVSMMRIESRPSRRGRWEYLFFVDLEGHADAPPVSDALEDLRGRVASLKMLGAYPRAICETGP